MSVNGVTSTTSTTNKYDTAAYKNGKETASASKSTNAFSEEAAVYESSSKTVSKADHSALIAQMKQDTANRTAQLESLVQKMFLKQGQTFSSMDDMWKSLANGELTVDAATAAQAKEDISEDGYWGVKQTSDRIFDFAMALSGGDKDTMEDMLKAFEKGYQQAAGTWGKSLPSICSDTYDAVQDKFSKYFEDEE